LLTYRIRPRVFRIDPPKDVQFPAECLIRMFFSPLQPFGMQADGGRTAVFKVAAQAIFNSNTGIHWIESKEPLKPLDVTITSPTRHIELKGNRLEITERFDSLRELTDNLETYYYILPILLNVDYADPPIIDRVEGRIGEAHFRWELNGWRMDFATTTQELQEQRFADAYDMLGVLSSQQHNRRLVAALHYFHVAVRLSRAGSTPGEFLAEVILNLTKTLEVLFPPGEGVGTREGVRIGLRILGYSDEEIERDFIPAMALRNEIDVGHVDLSLFNTEQLKLIHGYTERVEQCFRELLARIVAKVKQGTWQIPEHVAHNLSTAARKVLDRLSASSHPDAA